MPALKIRSIVAVVVISKDSMILLRGPPKTRNRLWMLRRQPSRIQRSSRARRTATTSRLAWRTIALEWLKWTNTTQQEAAISWRWAQQKPPKALIILMMWCFSRVIAVVTNLVDVTRPRSSTPPTNNTPSIKPCSKHSINRCRLLQPQLTRSWRYWAHRAAKLQRYRKALQRPCYKIHWHHRQIKNKNRFSSRQAATFQKDHRNRPSLRNVKPWR